MQDVYKKELNLLALQITQSWRYRLHKAGVTDYTKQPPHKRCRR